MTEAFFKFARDRHQIYLNRQAGMKYPWSNDPILNEYKFTNVFRELDKTTEWFKWNVRDPMRDCPEVLLATVIFRWFNRIVSGEAIFCQRMINRYTPFDDYLKNGDIRVLRAALKSYCGDGPYFTGAYMIRSPNDMDKLNGMLKMIDQFAKKSEWESIAKYYIHRKQDQRLESLWSWLKKFECQGPFHAYEVVTDLRWTAVMDHAVDINLWANPGPGCKRGVSRILGLGTRRTKTTKRLKQITPSSEEIKEVLSELLIQSRDPKFWPWDWQKWEMREVEHTLCEWDKYERIRLGQGKMKGRYHHG